MRRSQAHAWMIYIYMEVGSLGAYAPGIFMMAFRIFLAQLSQCTSMARMTGAIAGAVLDLAISSSIRARHHQSIYSACAYLLSVYGCAVLCMACWLSIGVYIYGSAEVMIDHRTCARIVETLMNLSPFRFIRKERNHGESISRSKLQLFSNYLSRDTIWNEPMRVY